MFVTETHTVLSVTKSGQKWRWHKTGPTLRWTNKRPISGHRELEQTVARERIENNPWIKKMRRVPTSETSSHRPVYSNNRPETTHPDRQRGRKMEREGEVRDRGKVQEWAQEGEHKKTGKSSIHAWIRPVAIINKRPIKKGLMQFWIISCKHDCFTAACCHRTRKCQEPGPTETSVTRPEAESSSPSPRYTATVAVSLSLSLSLTRTQTHTHDHFHTAGWWQQAFCLA